MEAGLWDLLLLFLVSAFGVTEAVSRLALDHNTLSSTVFSVLLYLL